MTTTLEAPRQKLKLTAEEMAIYERDGLVVPNYRLSKDLVGRMLDSMEKLIRDNPNIRPEMLLGVHIPKGYSGTIKGRTEFLDYAMTPEILDLVEGVIGPDIIFWGSQVICKPGGDGMPVPWHQDGEYWPIRPLETCTVWIALEDANTENGCMRYIPGSHKARRLQKHHVNNTDRLALNQELDRSTYNEADAKDDVLEAGQFSLHDIYLIHGSNANKSPRRRACFIIRYMPSTSHFDRTIVKEKFVGKDENSAVNFGNRPIWLARGVDRHGKNDFAVGHD
jgi:hypothetical protein